ncbi:MAG: hypothetical protein K6C14_08270, partial [Eubacterium sp.]|nr:hypothetical protein [Eubacterium sp.]
KEQELAVAQRQRIKEILKHPDDESAIDAEYDAIISDIRKEITGIQNQISMCENTEESIKKIEKTKVSVTGLLNEIQNETELTQLQIKSIAEKIYVYENRIEIVLNADIEQAYMSTIPASEFDVDTIAREFFEDEIIQTATHQLPKKYSVEVKTRAPFSTDMERKNQEQSQRYVEKGPA